MTVALRIDDLHAAVGGVEILKGLTLEVPYGEVHAVMGPNGSGKSTLCHVLTGKADYTVTGSARLGDDELLDRPVDDRARLGLMQAFQYPVEVPGVSLSMLIEEAAAERGIDVSGSLVAEAARFDVARFLDRSINDDLSGGEKKRSEIFQMAVLKPKVALLDEIDSGLDIDAVRQVSEAVEAMRSPDVGILMITHYSRILRYLTADRIHVMIDGRIVASGGSELAEELETGGYVAIQQRLGIAPPASAAPAKRPADFFTDTPFD